MLRRLLIFVVALFALPAQAQQPVILVLGDSLSANYGMREDQGWVELLRQRLAAAGYPHRVVNASISGDTTSGGLARLPQALARHRPTIVIIELGGNDGLRGLPLTEMRNNLAAMIEQTRAAGAEALLVGMQIPPNYGPAYARQFHAVYGELANQYQVPLVPFLLEGIATDLTLMQEDGIHPRPEAQQRILDNLWPHLEPLLGARQVSPQPQGMPAG